MKYIDELRTLDIDAMADFICRMKLNHEICRKFGEWTCLRCHWSKLCRLWSADFIRRWLYKKANDLDAKETPKGFKLEIDRIRHLDTDGFIDFIAGMKKRDFKCKKAGACEKCAWYGLCKLFSLQDVKAWLEMPIREAIEKTQELREKERKENAWKLILND